MGLPGARLRPGLERPLSRTSRGPRHMGDRHAGAVPLLERLPIGGRVGSLPMDTMNVTAPHGVRRLAPAALQEFLLHEADLLSEQRFEEWLGLFTEDCVYWMPA